MSSQFQLSQLSLLQPIPSIASSVSPPNQASFQPLRPVAGISRLGQSTGSLSAVRGAALIPLPLLKPDDEPQSPSYDTIYEKGDIPSQPMTVPTISRFLEFALALSAWKRAGDMQWALRSNPSSGNLHPTEGYLVLPQVDGLDLRPGLYHYAPKEHGLELRAEVVCREQVHRLLAPFPP